MPASPTKSMISLDTTQDPCQFTILGSPLGLLEAVERALCNNPQTREAWANVKQQTALVGINKAAFLPTVNGSLGATWAKGAVLIPGYTGGELSYGTATSSGNLNLNWVLFDFGLRSANLENAIQLLTAASANQDATLQTVFMTAAQDYYNLMTAQELLTANEEAEKSAKESYLAADAKHKAGINDLADKLQAQTNYTQTILNRVKSNEALKNAQGTLAIDMGLNVITSFTLDTSSTPLPDTQFVKSVDRLLQEAKRIRPELLAAQAQLLAAQANVKAAKATLLPTVTLTGGLGYSTPLGHIQVETITRSNYVGVQVNAPIFDGFVANYQIRSAKAQVEYQTANLKNIEQQITLDVWKSYQSLSTETENLKATDDLLHSANQSFKVALGRYKAGVGTILELLAAQSALASAQQQHIQASSDWRTARLNLAHSLGKLGLWAIQ